jgi:hypothetical protein
MNMRNKPSLAFAIATLYLLAAGLVPAPVVAGDNGFGRAVKQVESTYHVRRSYRFILGVGVKIANVAARPEGVSHLKLALFQNEHFRDHQSPADLLDVVRGTLGPEWRPFVEVKERDGERTLVYARDAGKNAQLLVVTTDQEDTVLVQVEINPERMAKLMDHPHCVRRSKGERSDGDAVADLGF